MEHVQPNQLLIPGAIALVIGLLWLIWGDRPELGKAILSRLAGRAVRAQSVKGYREVMSNEDADCEGDYTAEVEPRGSAAISRTNPVEPDLNGSLNPVELALNADEVAAVARMIEHKITAKRATKSSAIQAGFGVSRGGSQTYLRASTIYDALFGAPAPAVQYRRSDGSTEPPTHPVTGRTPLRTRAR
jgi:hypothetical protein